MLHIVILSKINVTILENNLEFWIKLETALLNSAPHKLSYTERRDAAVIKGSQWILKAQEKNKRSMCGQRLCNYHSGKGVLLSVHNLILGGIYINKTKQLKTNSREGLS